MGKLSKAERIINEIKSMETIKMNQIHSVNCLNGEINALLTLNKHNSYQMDSNLFFPKELKNQLY